MEQRFLNNEITEEELLEFYETEGEGALTAAPVPPVFQGAKWLWRVLRAKKGARGIDARVIREIKALADGSRLTRKQVRELGKNIDAVLSRSLPEKAARGHVQDVVDLLKTDARFRFIDQVPGAQQKIADALAKYGVSWP